MNSREFAIDVVARLQSAGFVAYWAGGCVRDERLGLTPADYDVATSAHPEQVQQIFRRTVAIGAAFGVIDVIGPKVEGEHLNVQVATFRSDGVYLDGRRPETVTYGTAEADAARRDFTVNGLFFDPLAGRLIDYVGGQDDLDRKVLRAIGDPRARFGEDKLRILRAVRMAARFDFSVDPATADAAKAMVHQVIVVSAERIADEFRKLFAHPNRARGVALMRDWGLMDVILPEAGDERPVAGLPRSAGFELTLALLLNGRSKADAEKVGRRLKLSNDEIKQVTWLVEHAESLVGAESFPPSRLYPLLAHTYAHDLLDFHRANGVDVSHGESVLKTLPRETLDPPPLLTGDDLKALGFKQGPGFRVALEACRAAQLDGKISKREDALNLAAETLGMSK